MKVALLKPPARGNTFRGVDFYAERLLAGFSHISGLEVESVLFSPLNSYSSFDLVHVPFFEPYFFSLPLAAKPPVVITIHDAIRLVFPDKFPSGLRGKLEFATQKPLLKKVSHFVTDSNTSRIDLTKLLQIPEQKITVTYLAADSVFHPLNDKEALMNVKHKYQLPEKFLLYVGGANWNKNVLALCQAAQELKVPVVIVGKEWVNQDIDKNHIETEPLRDIKKIIGGKNLFICPGFVPTEDLVAIYNLATLYVQPSFYEGFGLPLLEAMQSGCPALSARNSSLEEIGGGAISYFDPYSVEDLISHIKSILCYGSQIREKMIKKQFDQANKFSWEKTAAATYEVYRQVLG